MTATSSELYVTWVLSCADGQDHAITDEENTRVYRDRCGLPEAVCGHRVVAGSLAFPPGPRCLECEAVLRASTVAFDPDLEVVRSPRHRNRALCFVRRLFDRRIRSIFCHTVAQARRAEPDRGERVAAPVACRSVATHHRISDDRSAASAPVTRTE